MNTQMLRNILEALMTVNVRGNDAITLSNCMQALQQVIVEAESAPQTASLAQEEDVRDAE